MGVMNSIREQTGSLFVGVMVVAFGGLWMLQDSGAFDNVGTGGVPNVALVNDEPVTMQQYQQAVEQQVQAYQQSGQDVTPALRAQIEEQVYTQLVDAQLREQEMQRIGVRVSEDEVYDAVYSDNPDPVILQFFGGEDGKVDLARFEQFRTDPAAAQDVVAMGEYLRQVRQQRKLDALIAATARVSDAEVAEEYRRQNATASVRYVPVRYSTVADDEVEVTDRDLKGYYDDNREDFRRQKTYTVEYTALQQVPSADDSTRALQRLRQLKPEFERTTNDSLFVTRDMGAFTPVARPADAFGPAIATAIFSDPTPGRVVGPMIENGEARLVKVLGTEPAATPSVRAQHILFRLDQEELANEVKGQLESGQLSFAAAAARYSTDTSNKDKAGELGWFGEGRMVPAFQEAAFDAPVGTVVGPVQTQFGHHLVRVQERSDVEVRFTEITRELTSTFQGLRDKADDVRYYSVQEGRPFAEEVERQELALQEATVLDDQRFVPGLQLGPDAIRWIKAAEAGDISEPFDTGSQFVVMHVAEVQEEGIRPFDEVRDQLEPRVLREKKEAVVLERMREAAGSAGSLQALASSLGETVQSVDALKLSARTVASLGREPAFIGAAFGLPVGTVSKPIAGQNAAYVLEVTSRQDPDLAAIPEATRTQIRQSLLQRKQQQVQQAWMEALRDRAEITDFRSRIL